MEADVNLHDIDRTINNIRHDYQKEWEDEDWQRRRRAEDEERGRRHAGSKANPHLFMEGDQPSYLADLAATAVTFVTKTDRFSRIGEICRLIKSRVATVTQDIEKVLVSIGMPKGSTYEWPEVRSRVERQKELELQERMDEDGRKHRTKLNELSARIEGIKIDIAEAGGKKGSISDEELRGYESRNNLMRAAFYAALTAFVLAEAVVNGVGFEAMGFNPTVSFLAAGLLGAFLFWSAHLLGSYIKQANFYASKDRKNKQRAFTALFVIIALAIFMFFTETRHDYLTQLQDHEGVIDLLSDNGNAGAEESDQTSVAYGAYDYLFMFINVLIYFLGVFVSWLISPKSRELKKVCLERARLDDAHEKKMDRCRVEGKRKIEEELNQLQGNLDAWTREKASLEFKLRECVNFYQESVTNLARLVHRRFGHYIDAYQLAAQERFPTNHKVTQDEIRERIQDDAALADLSEFALGPASARPDTSGTPGTPGASDNVTKMKAS